MDQAQRMAVNRQQLRQDYFDTWSDVMAYHLGYLFADGNVLDGRNHKLALECATEDEEIILEIRAALNSNHQISRKPARKRRDGVNAGPMTQIQIYGGALIRTLVDIHGVLPAKSRQELPFPQIPSIYLPHFVRGYHVGDGSVSHDENKRKTIVGFYGNHRFLMGLREALVEHVGVPRYEISLFSGIWGIRWQSTDDIRKLYVWMKPDDDLPYLSRKQKVFDRILKNDDAVEGVNQLEPGCAERT